MHLPGCWETDINGNKQTTPKSFKVLVDLLVKRRSTLQANVPTSESMWRLSEQKCTYLFTLDKLDSEFAQVQHQLTQPQTTERTAKLTPAELGHKWGRLSPLSGPT